MTIYYVSGASRGIGVAFVQKLLEDPANNRVAAAARNPHGSAALQSLSKTYGDDRLLLVKMDTTDTESIKAAADLVNDKWGSVDVLINNAGVAGDVMPCSLLEEPLEQIETIFRTNVLGPLATTRAFYQLLLKGTKKTVVNISSIIGSIDFHMDTIAAPEIMTMKTYVGGYSISKAALNMQSTMLANQTKTDGVIVISMHPGSVDTDMAQSVMPAFKLPPGVLKLITPEESVTAQLKVIDGLSAGDNGKFFSYDGSILPF